MLAISANCQENEFSSKSPCADEQVAENDRPVIKKHLSHLFAEGNILPLGGGKSGDSLYVASLKAKKFVIRIMPKDRLEAYSQQLAYSQIAAQQQIGPSVLYQNAEDKVCLTEFIKGVPLTPTLLDREDLLLKLSCALRCLHNACHVPAVQFEFAKDVACRIQKARQDKLYTANKLTHYLTTVEDIGAAIKRRGLPPKPCHNDIHAGNVFCDENQRIKIIDWGDAALGDPFFDLARASIEFHLSKSQIEKFLNSYFRGNLGPVDRAHFLLTQCAVLLKIGLYFLALSDLDDTTRCALQAFFEKNSFPFKLQNLCSPQSVAQVIFDAFEQQIASDEFKQAMAFLQQN